MSESDSIPKPSSAPNFYAPKYAEYIWKGHAPNFIKYIDELDSGDDDRIMKMTDPAIADIWAVLENDERTLDQGCKIFQEKKVNF